ncbi:MAG: GNAT family N-acetyltransferase [Bryobacteraceae bacterium]|nr:GNAT family N-acetyltransferase [Bryobacteraceae bacterium]
MIEVREAGDLDLVRELFREYQTGVNAPVCFASFDSELASLPAPYAAIWIAWVGQEAAGCVALKPGPFGEVKRLYVRPAYRGQGVSRALMAAAVAQAHRLGCASVRLDTLPFMAAAIALYESLGFARIARYNDTPDAGTLFFELPLGRQTGR